MRARRNRTMLFCPAMYVGNIFNSILKQTEMFIRNYGYKPRTIRMSQLAFDKLNKEAQPFTMYIDRTKSPVHKVYGMVIKIHNTQVFVH